MDCCNSNSLGLCCCDINCDFLDSLFIYKMLQVTKGTISTGKNTSFMKVITKTSLLTLISSFITVITFTGLALEPMMTSIHLYYLHHVLIVVDVYTNALCVFLTYGHFNSYYYKLCGCCDSNCHIFWIKFTHEEVNQTSGAESTDM
eukprot:611521_1